MKAHIYVIIIVTKANDIFLLKLWELHVYTVCTGTGMLKTYFSPSIYSSIYSSNYHQMIILLFIFTFRSVTCCLSAAMFIKSLKSIFRQSDWSVFVTHHLHEIRAKDTVIFTVILEYIALQKMETGLKSLNMHANLVLKYSLQPIAKVYVQCTVLCIQQTFNRAVIQLL